VALLKKDIEGLREAYNLDDVDNAIDEYEDISRVEFNDDEEYQEERDIAWEEILGEIDTADKLD